MGQSQTQTRQITAIDRLSMGFAESIGGDGDVVNGRGE